MPAYFVKVHRSYIVDINKVVALKIGSGASYQLLMQDNIEVPVSRSHGKIIIN